MAFLDALFQGLYMGISAFAIPTVLILFSLYFSIRCRRNLGATIFIGRFLAYFICCLSMFTGLNLFIESDDFHMIISFISAFVCIFLAIKTLIDAINHRDEPKCKNKNNEDDFSEYEDISSKNYGKSDETAEFVKSRIKFPTFFTSLALSISSSEFIYWCDFSLYGMIYKVINYTSSGVVSALFLLVFLFAVLFICDVLFSRLSIFIGKFIKPLIMRPFIIIVSLSFFCFAFFFISKAVTYF